MGRPGRPLIPLAFGLLLATPGCTPTPSVSEVVIDLTAPSHCTVTGEAKVASDEAGWTTGAGEEVDVYLRLPHQSSLRFATAPPVPSDSLRVRISSDDRREETLLLDPASAGAEATGAWHSSTANFDGEVVRLRFENRSNAALRWKGPRVTGTEAVRAAPLGDWEAADGRPNIVLYLVDTLRADRLSAYGYERRTSPKLERLAGRSVLFENAYAPGPSTLATLPSLFTSRYSSTMSRQLRERDNTPWTFPELLRGAGYRTAGFQANPWVSESLGFGRGFIEYDLLPGKDSEDGWRHPSADAIEAAALDWLDRSEAYSKRLSRKTAEGGRTPGTAHRAPFFLFLQTMDVHLPYDPPSPFREQMGLLEQPAEPRAPRPLTELRQILAGPAGQKLAARQSGNAGRYEGAVAYADHAFARFLAELEARDLLENTVVFLTSDHGEALGNFDDGTFLHGHSLYEEAVHVPLVVVLPAMLRGLRQLPPVSLLDLAPTILDLAGVPIPDGAAGRSLLVRDRASCPRAVVGERAGDLQRRRGVPTQPTRVKEWYVREGRWKLLGGPDGGGLFDLEADPHEITDRREARPILAAYLESIRNETVTLGLASPDAEVPESLPAPIQERIEEALHRLGYLE